jgi:hypothetical protein
MQLTTQHLLGTTLALVSLAGAIMRVAIPEHQGRVGPVFDYCGRILIFLQDASREELLADEDWSMLPRLARAGRLKELVVEALVCGGITCCMEDLIRRYGIRTIPWISGDVWEVMAALRMGKIDDPCYAMPGRMRGRRQGRYGEMCGMGRQALKPCRKGD